MTENDSVTSTVGDHRTCPDCDAVLSEENYETVENGAHRKVECDECGYTSYRETFVARVQQSQDDEETDASTLQDHPHETPDGEYNPVLDDEGTVTFSVDDSITDPRKCIVEGCDTTLDDPDVDRMRQTVESDGNYCPDHFEAALEQGEQAKYTSMEGDE